MVMQTPAAAKREIPVMVQTVPASPGVQFALNGERFTSDDNGLALTTVSKLGTYRLEVIDDLVVGNKRRSEFSRWSDDVTKTTRQIRVRTFFWLQAGFDVSFRTRPQFTFEGEAPISPERVDVAVLRSDDGRRLTLDGGDPHWIPARTLKSTSDGVKPKTIAYTVESVVVDGRESTPVTRAPVVLTVGDEWEVKVQPPRSVQAAPSGDRDVAEFSTNWLFAIALAGALVLAGAFWLSRSRPGRGIETAAHVDPQPPAAMPERVIDLRSRQERSTFSGGSAHSDAGTRELDNAILEAQRFIERLEAERRQLAEDQAARHGSSRGHTSPQ
jgi:hypothetical protein